VPIFCLKLQHYTWPQTSRVTASKCSALMLAVVQPTVDPRVLGQHVHISEQIVPAIALLSQGLDRVNPVATGGQGFLYFFTFIGGQVRVISGWPR
jgi:hypothetical protein